MNKGELLKRWIVILVLAAAGTFLVREYVVEGIYIATASMAPTLPVGAHYFEDKWTYHFRDPKRGEIVVFKPPVTLDKELVKRVIAIPGDHLQIINKRVYLNGKLLDEPYVVHSRPNDILMDDNISEITVPPHDYFVMGDNRDVSGDSRDWLSPVTGKHVWFVPRKNIKGRLLDVVE